MGSKSPIVEVNRQKVDMGNTMNTILRQGQPPPGGISGNQKNLPPPNKKKSLNRQSLNQKNSCKRPFQVSKDVFLTCNAIVNSF